MKFISLQCRAYFQSRLVQVIMRNEMLRVRINLLSQCAMWELYSYLFPTCLFRVNNCFFSSSCCQAFHETCAHFAAGWRCSLCAVQPQPETAGCLLTGLHCEDFLRWHTQGACPNGLWVCAGSDVTVALKDQEYVGKVSIYCGTLVRIRETMHPTSCACLLANWQNCGWATLGRKSIFNLESVVNLQVAGFTLNPAGMVVLQSCEAL